MPLSEFDSLTTEINNEFGGLTAESGNEFGGLATESGNEFDSLITEINTEHEPTQYHVAGALKSAALQGLRGLGGLPRTLGFAQTAKNVYDYYDNLALQSDDVQDYNQSVGEGTESLLTEIPGSMGPTVTALGMSMLPGGMVASTAYFFHQNKDEIKEMALSEGADETSAEIASWVTAPVVSALDMFGISLISGKNPFMKKLAQKVKSKAVRETVRFLGGNVAGKTVTSMSGEGLTEGIQHLISKVSATAAASKNPVDFAKRVFSDEWVDETWKDAKKEGLFGFATAGILSPVGMVAGRSQSKQQEAQLERGINQSLSTGGIEGKPFGKEQALSVINVATQDGILSKKAAEKLIAKLPSIEQIEEAGEVVEASEFSAPPQEVIESHSFELDRLRKEAEPARQIIERDQEIERSMAEYEAPQPEIIEEPIVEETNEASEFNTLSQEIIESHSFEPDRMWKDGEPARRIIERDQMAEYEAPAPEIIEKPAAVETNEASEFNTLPQEIIESRSFEPDRMWKDGEPTRQLAGRDQEIERVMAEYKVLSPEKGEDTPDDSNTLLKEIEVQGYDKRAIEKASSRYRKPIEDRAIKAASSKTGYTESEIRETLSDPKIPELDMQVMWDEAVSMEQEIQVEKLGEETAIPDFKTEGEAGAFGETATTEQVAKIRDLWWENKEESARLLKEGKSEKAMEVGFKSQLYHEALQKAGYKVNQQAETIEDVLGEPPKGKSSTKVEAINSDIMVNTKSFAKDGKIVQDKGQTTAKEALKSLDAKIEKYYEVLECL